METILLNTGHPMPVLGLGTWNLRGEECTRIVSQALALGYTHIDTAHVYENHKAIAPALKGKDRSKLFLTSKLDPGQIPGYTQGEVAAAFDRALNELQVDYLDLYLLHYPEKQKPYFKAVEAMQHFLETGKARAIGVSNCTRRHLAEIKKHGLHPSVNQVEFHPYLYQKELLETMRREKMVLVSYRSLGKGALLSDPLLTSIGKQHNKSSAQVILRWCIQQKIPVIPKASSEQHLKANLALFDFHLSDHEMSQINGLNRNERFCNNPWFDFDED